MLLLVTDVVGLVSGSAVDSLSADLVGFDSEGVVVSAGGGLAASVSGALAVSVSAGALLVVLSADLAGGAAGSLSTSGSWW